MKTPNYQQYHESKIAGKQDVSKLAELCNESNQTVERIVKKPAGDLPVIDLKYAQTKLFPSRTVSGSHLDKKHLLQ